MTEKKMNEKTIESARSALWEILNVANELPLDDEWKVRSALRKLKNFVDLAEKELDK